jgi:hypothetical protein
MTPGEGAAKILTSFHSELSIFVTSREQVRNVPEESAVPLLYVYDQMKRKHAFDS